MTYHPPGVDPAADQEALRQQTIQQQRAQQQAAAAAAVATQPANQGASLSPFQPTGNVERDLTTLAERKASPLDVSLYVNEYGRGIDYTKSNQQTDFLRSHGITPTAPAYAIGRQRVPVEIWDRATAEQQFRVLKAEGDIPRDATLVKEGEAWGYITPESDAPRSIIPRDLLEEYSRNAPRYVQKGKPAPVHYDVRVKGEVGVTSYTHPMDTAVYAEPEGTRLMFTRASGEAVLISVKDKDGKVILQANGKGEFEQKAIARAVETGRLERKGAEALFGKEAVKTAIERAGKGAPPPTKAESERPGAAITERATAALSKTVVGQKGATPNALEFIRQANAARQPNRPDVSSFPVIVMASGAAKFTPIPWDDAAVAIAALALSWYASSQVKLDTTLPPFTARQSGTASTQLIPPKTVSGGTQMVPPKLAQPMETVRGTPELAKGTLPFIPPKVKTPAIITSMGAASTQLRDTPATRKTLTPAELDRLWDRGTGSIRGSYITGEGLADLDAKIFQAYSTGALSREEYEDYQAARKRYVNARTRFTADVQTRMESAPYQIQGVPKEAVAAAVATALLTAAQTNAKTAGQTSSKAQADSETEVLEATKEALQAQTAQQIQAQTRAATKAATRTATQTATQTRTATKAATRTATQTATQTQTAVQAQQAVSTATQEAAHAKTAEATREAEAEANEKQKRPRPKDTRDDEDFEPTAKDIANATALKAGFIWWLRFQNGRVKAYRELPKGVTNVVGGEGSGYRSVQTVQGKPATTQISLGIFRAEILKPSRQPGRQGAVRYNPIPHLIQPHPARRGAGITRRSDR